MLVILLLLLGKSFNMMHPLERITGKSSMDPNILDRYLSLPQNGMIQAEYVFIDAIGKCRSKTRTLSQDKAKSVGDLPEWTYDGSSTGQAPGEDSEVIIKPQKIYPDPFRPGNGNILVMCDTYTPEGKPLPTNTRFNAANVFSQKESVDATPWFGLEQEYTLFNLDNVTPLGWPANGYPMPQGPYYCGAGADRVFGRAVPEAHYRACLYAGIPISGINAEVMPGQWEYQIGPAVGINAGDDVWMARYLLDRVCEDFGVMASIHPKPITHGDWNGAGVIITIIIIIIIIFIMIIILPLLGMHINFSTKEMRQSGGMDAIIKAINRLGARHKEHIAVYGEDNELRLTGKHETASINEFSYGVANRGCSVRIPRDTNAKGYGYFEDRRPASNVDPYVATAKIMSTIMEKVDAPPALRKDKAAAKL